MRTSYLALGPDGSVFDTSAPAYSSPFAAAPPMPHGYGFISDIVKGVTDIFGGKKEEKPKKDPATTPPSTVQQLMPWVLGVGAVLAALSIVAVTRSGR